MTSQNRLTDAEAMDQLVNVYHCIEVTRLSLRFQGETKRSTPVGNIRRLELGTWGLTKGRFGMVVTRGRRVFAFRLNQGTVPQNMQDVIDVLAPSRVSYIPILGGETVCVRGRWVPFTEYITSEMEKVISASVAEFTS